MGQIILAPPGTSSAGVSPPFVNVPLRQNPSGDYSYAALHNGAGTGQYVYGYLNLQAGASSGDWARLARVQVALDLSAYSGLTWTDATIEFTPSTVNNTNAWPSSNHNSVALCGQSESTRSSTTTSLADYANMYNGSLNEYASRLPLSGLSVGVTSEFTLNAAGINYLNSVQTKPNFPGIAYFAVLFGGDVDYASAPTPIWVYPYVATVRMETITVKLNFATESQINVGGVWKDISDMYINVGDVWKPVETMDINIGDDWKTS